MYCIKFDSVHKIVSYDQDSHGFFNVETEQGFYSYAAEIYKTEKAALQVLIRDLRSDLQRAEDRIDEILEKEDELNYDNN
jgi:hypothetical protein